MTITSTRARLLASSMICSAAAAVAGHAWAQQAKAPTPAGELVVTGSRIPTQNLSSSSPLTVVSSQEAKLEGTVSVETLLNNLPQVFASFTEGVSNAASGTATVNLRNLGSARTLVLIDGKRLMPADPIVPFADLNQVPASLVDHVEVVTGGASAVYGSDAVAGVVNFIMKKNFEGVRLDAQWGEDWHDNNNSGAQAMLAHGLNGNPAIPIGSAIPKGNVWLGRTFDITAVIGVNAPDGKGNATIYAGYRNVEGVTQDKYDYSACSTIIAGANNDHLNCFGSSNQNRFIPLTGNNAGNSYFPLPGRGVRPRVGSDVFNFAPFNYFQRPDERYVAGGFAHYEISPMADVYLDAMFSDDHTLAQIAPSGLFIGTGLFGGNVHLNCDNPLLSAAQAAAFCAGLAPTDDVVMRIGRRNVEGGARVDDLRHTSYKIDFGLKGDLGKGWSYDVYGQYGTTIYNENYQNELSVSRVQNALEVVNVGGVPTCKVTVANIDPKCVPLDIFTGLGNVNAAGLAYVNAQGFKSGRTTETVVSASLTGDLGAYGMKSPWAGAGLGLALGAEYRREGLELLTSRDFQLNDLYGQGSPTLPQPYSTYQVKEAFTELRIPIVDDMPFFKSLTADLQARYSDYSSAGVTWAYAAKVDWGPTADFRIRASYQRAVRAPNIVELFAAARVTNVPGNDPCSSRGGAGPALTLAQCLNTGITVAQYGSPILDCPAGQCRNLLAGNTALKPEKADTYSVGIVLTPRFLRGFTATADWFSIKLNNQIGTIPPLLSLAQCATTASPFFCSLIHRDSFGTIASDTGYITATNINTGFLKTSGVDVGAQYRVNLADWHLGDHGSLNFDFDGTWTKELANEPGAGLGVYDCAGLYGVTCGTQFTGPTPKWRHRLRMTWTTPWKVSLSVNWRYVSPVKVDFNPANNGANPLLVTGNLDNADNKIPSYSWFDLAATWAVKDGLTLRAGINNLFDKDPPIVDTNGFGVSAPPFGNGNTYPGTYDSLGRTLFVGITADF